MLAKIAEEMKEEAKHNGKAIRKLKRGLEVTFYDRNDCVYLRLYRGHENKLPSQTEINVCLQAFFGEGYVILQEGVRDDDRGGMAYWLKVGK